MADMQVLTLLQQLSDKFDMLREDKDLLKYQDARRSAAQSVETVPEGEDVRGQNRGPGGSGRSYSLGEKETAYCTSTVSKKERDQRSKSRH